MGPDGTQTHGALPRKHGTVVKLRTAMPTTQVPDSHYDSRVSTSLLRDVPAEDSHTTRAHININCSRSDCYQISRKGTSVQRHLRDTIPSAWPPSYAAQLVEQLGKRVANVTVSLAN